FRTLFGGGFGGVGGRGGGRSSGFRGGGWAQAGEDIEANLDVTLEEAYHGAVKPVNLEVRERNPAGGWNRSTRSLKVRIPKGVTDGKVIRLAGQGGAGRNGGPDGDM